jgi:hypothetical protein
MCKGEGSLVYDTQKTDNTFTIFCYADYGNGGELADGSGKVVDLLESWQYSLEDCLESCAIWNQNRAKNDSKYCKAVTYNWNLDQVAGEWKKNGNCWFKNGPGPDPTGASGGSGSSAASAKLILD